MITIRPSSARGKANFGWLDSRHTFSFGSYYDPRYLGFKNLLVINEDKVQPSKGFGTHSHRDMEIITYVLAGELEHKDSIGNGSIIRPGEVQRMSAGTGIAHSEYNASHRNTVHFLQIWIKPDTLGLKPSYEQKYFPPQEKQNQLRLVGSQDGRNNSITIHQDVNLYVANLEEKTEVTHILEANRGAWIQVNKGGVAIANQTLLGGDGMAIEQESEIIITATQNDTEILLFDLS